MEIAETNIHAIPAETAMTAKRNRSGGKSRHALATAADSPTTASAINGSCRRIPICTRQFKLNTSSTSAARQGQFKRALLRNTASATGSSKSGIGDLMERARG